MFSFPPIRDAVLTSSVSDASALKKSTSMAELMHQIRDPAHTLGGSVGSIPQSLISTTGAAEFQKTISGTGFHATPASNIKLSEALRNAQNDNSPAANLSKMKSSKSYTHGLSNSAGTVNIPTSTSAQSNLSLLADISPNHTHFFEVLYIGKIRVANKRVPFSFIDDTLPKFKAYDAQRARYMQMTGNRKMSLNSEGGINIDMKSNTISDSDVREEDENEEDEEQDHDHDHDQETTESNSELEAERQADLLQNDDSPHVLQMSEESPEREEKAKQTGEGTRSPIRKLLRGQSQLEISVKKDSKDLAMDPKYAEEHVSTKRSGTVIINKNPSPPRAMDSTATSAASTAAATTQGAQETNANYAGDK